ncbi:HNH endonuclease [Micrococcoides hystricis]|uniref:DUF222 domain-containing protein n=1 Tax=Micrococcoides hystricis TaxID=1572761 RepID=A0ABV6PAZ9_9MICC
MTQRVLEPTRGTHAPLDLQACIAAIHDANDAPAAEAPWFLDAEQQLQSYLFAHQLQRIYRKSATLAEAEGHRLDRTVLTQVALEKDRGKLRRKIEAAMLQHGTLRRAVVRQLIQLSVILHQHAPSLLLQLEAGAITVSTAQFLGGQLLSIPLPERTQKADGTPWQPREYAQAVQSVQEAQFRLGTRLAELSQQDLEEGELQQQARQLRDEHDPLPASDRQTMAAKTRHVRITPAEDGMAFLSAKISAGHGALIQAALTQRAQQLRSARVAADRTPAQLEADVLVDTLLTRSADIDKTSASTNRPAPLAQGPEVSVILELTLEQAINLGGFLDPERLSFLQQHFPDLYAQSERNRLFYGQPRSERDGRFPTGVLSSGATAQILGSDHRLNTAEAAEFLGRASLFHGILTNPFTGYPLGVGRRSYRLPRKVRQLIHYRDRICRYPGCRQPATSAELDHVHPWAEGGATGYGTMASLCPEHHRGKTAGWFTVYPRPELGDGVLEFSLGDSATPTLTKAYKPLDPLAWQAYQSETSAAAEPPF